MTDLAKRLSGSHDLAAKAARVLKTRAKLAQERFNERVRTACKDNIADLVSKPLSPQEVRAGDARYALARIRCVLGSAGSRRPRRVVAAK
jgi:hypothetical protein